MEFLQRALDDDTAAPCGRCDNCAGVWFPTDVAERAADSAAASLDRVGVPIEPRAPVADRCRSARRPVKGSIAAGEQRRRGPGARAPHRPRLGRGAARAVRREAPRMRRVSRHAARRLRSGCSPTGGGPSARRPSSPCRRGRRPLLVDSLARGLAEVGRLPYLGRARSADGGPTGQPGGNSVFRLAGLWDGFDAPSTSRSRTARCCSSTTSPTAAGRSRSPRAKCVAPGRPPCCHSPWRCAHSPDRGRVSTPRAGGSSLRRRGTGRTVVGALPQD